ncbi:hypothetical protein TWF730_006256 [Orbilia blumenaviensis]|uniref:Uncharacterized protein n=1 Tax=Orbilia blumenaviensis TaxID=1796055 RepID=A0AAV9VDR5_9PEZI
MSTKNLDSSGLNAPIGRKTLSQGFEEARGKFVGKYAATCQNVPTKKAEFQRFLQGTNVNNLEQICKEIGDKADTKVNNASRLWDTLGMLKTAGDAFINCAPESVSMVWFGVSSLVQIGNAKLQTQLLICGTCDSIANIIIDCIRWEARMGPPRPDDLENASKFKMWDSDIPELVFNVLDFLWAAKPYFDQNRMKSWLGSTLKDLFTKELQQKVDTLLEKYQDVVKLVQIHFEDSLLNESLSQNWNQTGANIRGSSK